MSDMLRAASKPNSFYRKADISLDEHLQEYPGDFEDIHNKRSVGEFKNKLNELIESWSSIPNTAKEQLGFHFGLINMRDEIEEYLNPNQFENDSPRLV